MVSLDIKTYSVYDIIEATDDIYSSIEHREIDIALQRWGTGRYVHYDEIGKNYNLTRERIRQMLAKIKDKFVKRNEKYFNEWFKLFLEELIDKPAPISSDFLKHCDTKYTPFVYLGLFSEIFNDIPFGNFFPKSFEQLVNRKMERVPRWAKIVELIHKLPINHGEMTPQNLTNILASKGSSISDQYYVLK